MKTRSDAMDPGVDAMDARVGDDAANVVAGSNCPHHRLASMEWVEHGVSHGGCDAVGHSGGHVVGPEGHVVDDACAIGHWETGGQRATRGQKGNNGQLIGNWKLMICFDFR